MIPGVEGVNVPHVTWYLEGDAFCDPKVNQNTMNKVPGQDFYSVLYKPDVGRFLYGQNDNDTVFGAIFDSLVENPGNVDSCGSNDTWTD